MSKDQQIVRVVQIDEQTVIHIHIHLTDDEIRRLLLPSLLHELSSARPHSSGTTVTSATTFIRGING